MELSRKRIIILGIVFAEAYIGWGLLLGLQPSFYPSEAEKKGATPSQYGFVFGIASLGAFIFAPLFGRFGGKIGPKYLYNLGALIQGIVGLSFGFLVYLQSTAAFLGLSYFLRFLDGVADAASWGAAVSILMKLFPNHVSSIMAWTEMVFGLGYMLGPAIGSALYQAGGFLLPFLVVGTWCMIGAIGVFFVVPNIKNTPDDEQDKEKRGKKLTYYGIAKNPSIFMPFVDNFIAFCGNGMIESMMEPHLKDAGASQTQVGYSFLLIGFVYMITTPIIGFICDRIKYPTAVSIVGNASMAVAFFFMGPVPFVNIEPSVSLIQGTMALSGFGYALVMVSTFTRSQAGALKHGFEDDIDTYLLISGLWSTAFYLGNFIGPTLGGIFTDIYGYRTTTVGFFVLYCLALVVDFFELTYNVKTRRRQQTYEELN